MRQEEEKVRFKDTGLENDVRDPGVCEHDSIFTKCEGRIRNRGSRQVGSRRKPTS